MSALPPCSRPLEFIPPLATRAEAWQAIPGVSDWVMGIIKRGYSLQFARRHLRFSCVVSTSVQGENARVLRSEVMTLLEKGAIEMVPPALSESGFYSRYFLFPKKDGSLRPILDLRCLNHALMRRPFSMKQIPSQIRTGDWFCSLDLKDAYFHIQIAPHHRRFLRFAFEGVAYQYTVLPFGLSLAPRTFTKCMDAAFSPLRQMGNRILNYLDDWLILAQSEVELLSHRTLILSHLERLGLRVNFAKSALSSSQRVSFLGTVLDSARMRAVIAPERALAIQKLAATFKSDTAHPLKAFQRMLGLMAAASPVLQLGLLCMHPLQRWLKPRADSATDSSPLARAPETGSPLSGERNNMTPSTRAVGFLPLAAQREPTGLPERVLNTISEARAPSTRRLYALKWSVFSTWCLNRGENPSTSELAVVLSFLQKLLDKGRSHSTLKVFVAAIAAFHAPIAGQSVGRDNSVVRFLKGARRLNPPRPLTVPTWDLPTVLRALKGPPFEPLKSTNLRSLSLKTALLLALASVNLLTSAPHIGNHS